MPFRKTVLVTGAASGIGRHLASSLAADGEKVYAADIDREGLEESTEQMQWDAQGVESRELDVSDPADWREVVDRIVEERGAIHLLVHAAGLVEPSRTVDVDVEAVERQVDVNLKGTIFGTRVVGARMADQGTGHIVHFGSLASLAAVPHLSVYAGTKHGVRGFSLSAAEELRDEGVDVTVVMPDAVDTAMLEEEARADDGAVVFSGRILSVDDVEQVFFDRVLPDRPLEVTIPRSRGGLARLANLVPGVTRWIRPLMEKIGSSRREEYRQRIADRDD